MKETSGNPLAMTATQVQPDGTCGEFGQAPMASGTAGGPDQMVSKDGAFELPKSDSTALNYLG